MIDSINGLGNAMIRQDPKSFGNVSTEPDFADRLANLLKDVNNKQHKADADAQKVITGELGIHEGMISMTEADIALRYMLQVRAKVMAAYNEIIRMPI